MPDSKGNFKGIAVPELPWLKQETVPKPVSSAVSGKADDPPTRHSAPLKRARKS